MDSYPEAGTVISAEAFALEPIVREPTPEQLARAAALRSFNRRYLYLPLGIISGLWFVTLFAMLWVAVIGSWFNVDTQQEAFRELFSGVADIVLISLFGFWLLVGMIPLTVLGYSWSKWRTWRKQRPPGALPIMWRIENVVVSVSENVAAILPLVARPVILAYAIAGYVRASFTEVKKILTRSK